MYQRRHQLHTPSQRKQSQLPSKSPVCGRVASKSAVQSRSRLLPQCAFHMVVCVPVVRTCETKSQLLHLASLTPGATTTETASEKARAKAQKLRKEKLSEAARLTGSAATWSPVFLPSFLPSFAPSQSVGQSVGSTATPSLDSPGKAATTSWRSRLSFSLA